MLLKNFTNLDRLGIKSNLVTSVFLLSGCQIALIKETLKKLKLKFRVKKVRKKMSSGSALMECAIFLTNLLDD